MIPYMVGKLSPNSSHLTRGLVKYVPGRPGKGYFCAVPSQNGDTFVTSPLPTQSLNGATKRPSNHVSCDCTNNTRISSPVVLNNKTRYVRYRMCGWLAMEQAADACESSWGRCTW